MERFKRILVVVDPADEEHKAINRSLHIGRLTQAKISLLLSIYDFSYEMTTMLSILPNIMLNFTGNAKGYR